MFDKVLIANRGAVAARVLRSLRALGIRSAAVYSEADAAAPYLEEADETYAIGPAHPRESYLNQDALIDVLKKSGADAVHPGYGFLAENPDFAERVEESGFIFIGPRADTIRLMGDKVRAKEAATEIGLPIVPGSAGAVHDAGEAVAVAKEIEEQNSHAVHMEVQPPETVQAAWEVNPVAFDDGGFIGLR